MAWRSVPVSWRCSWSGARLKSSPAVSQPSLVGVKAEPRNENQIEAATSRRFSYTEGAGAGSTRRPVRCGRAVRNTHSLRERRPAATGGEDTAFSLDAWAQLGRKRSTGRTSVGGSSRIPHRLSGKDEKWSSSRRRSIRITVGSSTGQNGTYTRLPAWKAASQTFVSTATCDSQLPGPEYIRAKPGRTLRKRIPNKRVGGDLPHWGGQVDRDGLSVLVPRRSHHARYHRRSCEPRQQKRVSLMEALDVNPLIAGERATHTLNQPARGGVPSVLR